MSRVTAKDIDAGRAAEIATREGKVDSALRAGNVPLAISEALKNPPRAASEELKERNGENVFRAMLAVKDDTQVSAVIESLNVEERDILMKYIHRGLEHKSGSAGQLLKW